MNTIISAPICLPGNIHATHRGRSIDTGLDCVGYALILLERCGIPTAGLDADYGDPQSEQSCKILKERLNIGFEQTCLHWSQWQDGDVLLLDGFGRRLGLLNHVGVVIGPYVYHFTTKAHRATRQRLSGYGSHWRHRSRKV